MCITPMSRQSRSISFIPLVSPPSGIGLGRIALYGRANPKYELNRAPHKMVNAPLIAMTFQSFGDLPGFVLFARTSPNIIISAP